MLPNELTEDAYWRDVHGTDVTSWTQALRAVGERHDLPDGEVVRFSLGRNVVLSLGPDLVVKFVPPFWSSDVPKEAAALDLAFERLPVATPRLVAHGRLDDWGYVVMTRLPGRPLRDVWNSLGAAERSRLAYRHGEIMAALHAVPPPAGSVLTFDWPSFQAGQLEAAPEALRRSGVNEALLADFPGFARDVWPALADLPPPVFLHGDLNFLNLLVQEPGGDVTVTGLVDFSDASLGPRGHEFISPGVHMYRGDESALASFYAGVNFAMTDTFARELTLRSALYYADGFQRMLTAIPGGTEARTWREVAARFWPPFPRATIAT